MRIVFLFFALLLAGSAFSQNRFTAKFQKADSVFLVQQDSVLMAEIFEGIESDTCKVTLTVKECMLLYFSGYTNGSFEPKMAGVMNMQRFHYHFFREKKHLLEKIKK
jgi:hypothetical protein